MLSINYRMLFKILFILIINKNNKYTVKTNINCYIFINFLKLHSNVLNKQPKILLEHHFLTFA